jgi:hypothetical protein
MTNPQYFPSQVISQYTYLVRDGSVQASAADAPYEFGVFPYLPLAKIQELYDPIGADFESKLGRPVWLSSKSEFFLHVKWLLPYSRLTPVLGLMPASWSAMPVRCDTTASTGGLATVFPLRSPMVFSGLSGRTTISASRSSARRATGRYPYLSCASM